MEVLVSDIVGAARAWANDDHNDNKGALIKPERYLQFLSMIYRSNYKRWMRSGLISPEPVDQEFTGPLTRIEGVLAVQGVARGNIYGFQGQTFDIQEFLADVPSVSFRVIGYVGTERPRVLFVPSGPINLTESGRDTTINFLPGTTTVQDIIELIASDSTIWELDSYDPSLTSADFQTELDNIQNYIALREIPGGEVRLNDFTLLSARQRWRTEKKPFSSHVNAPANAWEGFGAGSNFTIKLIPADQSSQTYIVRYYTIPNNISALTETIEVPDGGDEYLALKLAEWAMGTEGGASKTLMNAIYNAEAQQGFASAQILRPKLSSGSTPQSDDAGWPLGPADWVWC